MAWQETLDELATYMATLWADAENYLIESLAWRLERDRTIWDDDLARVRLINELRAITQQQVAELAARSPELAFWVAEGATVEGAAGIRQVLAQLLPQTTMGAVYGAQQLYAISAVATDLTSRLTDVNNRLLRFPDDVHQKLGAVLTTRRLTGQQHTIQFQREMLRDWYQWGIPAFVDVSGRAWRAGSYVEMLTRTGTQRALTEGRRTQLQASGFTYGLIQELPSACDACAPWAGAIVSLSNDLRPRQTLNLLTGQPMTVTPRATVEQARAAGWQHPNCRGTLGAYIPGADTAAYERPDSAELNRAEADLRQAERDIRQAKRDIIIDPTDMDAKRDLLDAQQRARDLVDDHDIVRRPWREALDWSGDRIGPTQRAPRPPQPPRRGTPPTLTPSTL